MKPYEKKSFRSRFCDCVFYRAARYYLPVISALIVAILASQAVAETAANENSHSLLGKNFLVVDGFIAASFEPLHAFLVVSNNTGAIEVYPANYIYTEKLGSKKQTSYPLHLYSTLKTEILDQLEKEPLIGVFFIEGEFSGLEASEAVMLHPERLMEASQNALMLSKQRKDLASQNHETEAEILTAEEEIFSLLSQVEKTGNLNETIRYRNKLANLQGEAITSTGEYLRLSRLLKNVRHTKPDPTEEQLRKELVLKLREITEKTSSVVRDANKDKRVSNASLSEKIRVIRRNRNKDSEELVRALSRLKQKREQLEIRAGISQEERDF